MKIFLKPIIQNKIFFIAMFVLGFAGMRFLQDGYVNRYWDGKPFAFAELFFDLYLVCAFISIFPKKIQKILRIVFTTIAYSTTFLDAFLFYKMHTLINFALYEAFVQTNFNEASDAVKTYFSVDIFKGKFLIFVLVALFHITIYIFYKNIDKIKSKFDIKLPTNKTKNFKFLGIGVLALFILCGMLCKKNKTFYYKIFTADGFEQFETVFRNQPFTCKFYLPIYQFLYAHKEFLLTKSSIKKLEKILTNLEAEKCSFTSKNIVLIIGESYNKHHSQLYGYSLPTTPRQMNWQQKENLVAFSDVVAKTNSTSDQFKNMLSMHGEGDSLSWCDYPLFPAIFKKNGYKVFFITNQFAYDANDMFTKRGSVLLNNPILSNLQFDYRNTRHYPYDESLLSAYKEMEKDTAENNLIIFHLIGQHFDYRSRFPKEFSVFKAEDYANRELVDFELDFISAYDNATLYNDYVVDQIIKHFSDKESIIIYLSDHGEMVYDGCNLVGRTVGFSREEIYSQYEIPFWIFTSNIYKENHPDVYAKILNAKDFKFMSDNIGQMLLFLGGIESKYYKRENSLLDFFYDDDRPRMLWGKINYDSIMENYVCPKNP